MKRASQATAFYAGDLSAQLEGFLDGWRIPDAVPQQLFGGVVPHAGWRYSGRTAARTLHTLVVRSRPRTFILFGTVHVPGVAGPSLYPEGAWETPVGDVEIDEKLAASLLDDLGDVLVAAPAAHDGDHALEVQMPFLRLLAPGARVVPVAMPPVPAAEELGRRLGQHLEQRPDVVVVASTDLTHYGSNYGFAPAGVGPSGERWLRENDARMVEKIRHLSATEVLAEAETQHNACGPGGLTVALASARARGSEHGHIIEYTNSHDVDASGMPFEFAVGYVGAVF